MITFKQHLLETSFLSTPILDLMFVMEMFPLSKPMLERILKTLPKITAFHITEPNDLKNLISIQRSKKSLSVFTKIGKNTLRGGIETNGGMVLELEGTLLASGEYDIWSTPDQQGRRWLDLNPEKVYDQKSDMLSLLQLIRKTTHKRITGEDYTDWWEVFRTITDENTGKLKQIYIKTFFDVTEELSKKYIKTVRNFLKGIRNDYYMRTNYNELIINEIKIKKIYINKDNENYSPGLESKLKKIAGSIPIILTDTDKLYKLI